MTPPLVAVFMVTYNHENYIAQAIESVLMQKTAFPIKLFIGEDFSTDRTASISLKYQQYNPELIKVISNLQNIGASNNAEQIYKICFSSGSKYIAMLEGDDYWTDPYKLQKQVDFLELNKDYTGCFHDVINVDENNILINKNYYSPSKTIFNQRDALFLASSYATCSLLFRKEVLNKTQKWFWKKPSDYALDLLITEYGFLAYMPNENMAAYRIHKSGIWQGNSDLKNAIELVERYLVFLSNKKFKRDYYDFLSNELSRHLMHILYNNSTKYILKFKYSIYLIRYYSGNYYNLFINILKIFIPRKVKNLIKSIIKYYCK